jgi:hypothetical protein
MRGIVRLAYEAQNIQDIKAEVCYFSNFVSFLQQQRASIDNKGR